jgi:hypothetical protein
VSRRVRRRRKDMFCFLAVTSISTLTARQAPDSCVGNLGCNSTGFHGDADPGAKS